MRQAFLGVAVVRCPSFTKGFFDANRARGVLTEQTGAPLRLFVELIHTGGASKYRMLLEYSLLKQQYEHIPGIVHFISVYDKAVFVLLLLIKNNILPAIFLFLFFLFAADVCLVFSVFLFVPRASTSEARYCDEPKGCSISLAVT